MILWAITDTVLICLIACLLAIVIECSGEHRTTKIQFVCFAFVVFLFCLFYFIFFTCRDHWSLPSLSLTTEERMISLWYNYYTVPPSVCLAMLHTPGMTLQHISRVHRYWQRYKPVSKSAHHRLPPRHCTACPTTTICLMDQPHKRLH